MVFEPGFFEDLAQQVSCRVVFLGTVQHLSAVKTPTQQVSRVLGDDLGVFEQVHSLRRLELKRGPQGREFQQVRHLAFFSQKSEGGVDLGIAVSGHALHDALVERVLAVRALAEFCAESMAIGAVERVAEHDVHPGKGGRGVPGGLA